ncbi:glycosyltransferase family 2 protein [Paenibacillus humicola]|uniref:glycosyltransferase family 2 protein n=1 Tax=Paenibacillus humicola TaxID=3110540 RepID=UPI00237AC908|nr:glycosyltransferase family 2 protein [Paenibacillus humicola]
MKRKKPAVRRVKRRAARPAAVSPSGFRAGFQAGYQEGLRSGSESYGTRFNGTSIIIPSYNQVHYLRQCIDSINRYTGPAYEIIVVDNASKDGTADYLRRAGGKVRYRILETNRGFSGAVNVGLMMAKGTTMLVLNNDTVVTARWLDNLLLCLSSDPAIGMVGPVTNYISGDQQIQVPYTKIEDMQAFAAKHNVSDSSKWKRIDRLAGVCLLFRRELWEQTGYFDEGFALGNFEDDDYNIRVRLQGRSLVIAGDTFIHHYGSISIRALGSHLAEVNQRNQQFYQEKWGNPHSLVHMVKEMIRLPGGVESIGQPPALSETSFFPEGIAVKGTTNTAYWIESGTRRPIAGEANIPVVRISQTDMRRWPVAETIAAEEAHARWHGGTGNMGDGYMVTGPDNIHYVLEKGTRRRIASRNALERWGLQHKPQVPLTAEQIGMLPEGLPVIAPAIVGERL